MEDPLGEARAALHRLNNAVATLRIQAAVARGAASGAGMDEHLARLDAAAEAVAGASGAVAEALGIAPRSLPAAAPAVPRAGAGAARVVVLVDDDPVLRAVLQRLLCDEGYDVVALGDAETAERRLAAGDPADVLVCDVELPGRDGRWLVGRARAHRPGLPAILLTGHPAPERVPGGTVLAKSVSPADLLAAIARMARDGEPDAAVPDAAS